MAASYRKSDIPEHLQRFFCPVEIGLEATPDAYVARLVAVFREVRRVLRDDGVCFLNLGDSYAGSRGAQLREHAGKHAPNVSALSANQVKAAAIRDSGTGSLSRTPGLKPKDLIGIPWRVAFALQADGWWLRQDIIWHKPNPMPESVRDRCTKAHEYVFLLTKSARYFFDSEAMKEPAQSNKGNGKSFRGGGSYTGGNAFNNHQLKERETHGNAPNEDGTRNRRSVWTIATQPYKGVHFATFPEALVDPCILAGSRPGDLVLDPFCGSGTVGVVCQRYARRFVGFDLNRTYLSLAADRLGWTAREEDSPHTRKEDSPMP